MTRRAMGIYAAAGGLSIYLATWIPSGSFYLYFQKEILRHDRQGGLGALLWARALPAAEAEARSATSETTSAPALPGWRQVLHAGALLPLPPGDLRALTRDGETLVARIGEAVLTLDRFPPGFLAGLHATEHRKVGGAPGAELDDQAALVAAAEATPEAFRLGMRSAERNRYAASILLKMLLWDSARPEGARSAAGGEGAASIVLFRSGGGRAQGALVRRADGTARVTVAGPEGITIYGLHGPVPAEWLGEPAAWGEVVPAPEEAARLWRQEVAKAHPSGHPLRKWAEAIEAPPAGR